MIQKTTAVSNGLRHEVFISLELLFWVLVWSMIHSLLNIFSIFLVIICYHINKKQCHKLF